MPYPVTINGKTYTEADFAERGYVAALPNIVGDVATVAGQVQTQANGATASAASATASASAANNSKIAAEAARDVAQAISTSLDFPYVTTTGTGTAYLANHTPDRTVGAGFTQKIRFHAAPAANATLQVDANTVYPLCNASGDNLLGGEFGVNHVDIAVFDASINKFKLAYLADYPLIQQAEGIFPVGSGVVSINPTRLKATPYAPLYKEAGARVGVCAIARYQIATDAGFTNIVHTITRTVAPFDEVFYNIGVLAENTTHYWRVQYQDTKGNVSKWSVGSVFITAASYNFDMLAFGHPAHPSDSRRLTVYDKDIATFTIQDLIAPADKITGNTIYFMDWHPSGRFLAVGHDTAPYFVIYDYGDGIPVKLTFPAWLTAKLVNPVVSVRFNKAGDKIFIGLGGGSQPAILANFSSVTGIGSEITLPSAPTNVGIYGCDFSFDGNYLAFTNLGNANATFMHVYSWIDGSGATLTNPIKCAAVSNFTGSSTNIGYACLFHPRYNQLYVGVVRADTGDGFMRVYSTLNAAVTDVGTIQSGGSFNCCGLAANAAGTRLLIAQNATAIINIWDINKANATIAPTSISISAAGVTSNTGIGNLLSVDPTGTFLASCVNSVNGAKPKVFDISADTFVEVTNIIPFAYFTGSGSHISYAVSFRFGKYGYPASS